MLIIQPDYSSKEAREWLLNIFVQIVDAIDIDTCRYGPIIHVLQAAEKLSYKATDEIVERAIGGLLK